MAKVFVAVDSGKAFTKAKWLRPETGAIREIKFDTKIAPSGDFRDDMFGEGTILAQIDDGPIYKVGFEADQAADMETSKKEEAHRICAMTAIAYACGSGTENEVSVAIGMPLQSCGITEEREDFKNYILGKIGEKHTVRIKSFANGNVVTVGFKFVQEKVYPEGMGVIYEHPAQFNGPTGIIDIGGLNMNALYVNDFVPYNKSCFTDEAGGKNLTTTLAQQLTSELGRGMRCDENMAGYVLSKPYEERYLVPMNGDKEIMEKSKQIIDSCVLEHVRNIKSKCDVHKWSMSFMKMVFIGGTSKVLEKELKAVFGDNIIIPENPEFINARGFLRKLCADNEINLRTYEVNGKPEDK